MIYLHRHAIGSPIGSNDCIALTSALTLAIHQLVKATSGQRLKVYQPRNGSAWIGGI